MLRSYTGQDFTMMLDDDTQGKVDFDSLIINLDKTMDLAAAHNIPKEERPQVLEAYLHFVQRSFDPELAYTMVTKAVINREEDISS